MSEDTEDAKPKVIVEGKSTLEILGQLDLFGGIGQNHLKRVVAIGGEERFKKNEKVFDEGDTGDKFYLILEGAVRISRFVAGMGEEALAVLRPGAYFGEMSLIDDESRSATDLAYEFLWKMVRTLSRRLRATNDKMTFLATSNKF
jgi:CRP/FNR family cyclic AMP-dependent transcriptional regulator